MKINSNYLKIFEKKETKNFLYSTILIKAFENVKFSNKQKIWGVIALFFLGVSFVMKAKEPSVGWAVGGNYDIPDEITPITLIIKQLFQGYSFPGMEILQASFLAGYGGLSIIKTFLTYISDIQLSSIIVVENTPFGKRNMFSTIYNGLTIFAIIGCLYKLIVHFLNTERHDNVKAYTGYFQYFSIMLLFVFSEQIVERVVGLNEGIKAEKLKAMTAVLNNELDNSLKTDLRKIISKIAKLENDNEEINKSKNGIINMTENFNILQNNIKILKLEILDGNFYLQVKYFYFAFFIMIFTTIMAIPAFILAIMVKVLLTVMVAGTKLVFLLAFIPGFENTWKTFMLNLLNILLWTPIFNALYGFIVSIIIGLMTDKTIESGQIIWLTIVAIILAFQSISLTTSAASVVINGAGAGLAGAMGSLSTMNGVNAGLGVAKAGLGVAGGLVGGMMVSNMAGKAMGAFGKTIESSVGNAMDKHMSKN